MIYSGKTLTLDKDPQGVATLCFDRRDGSVNKLDRLTLHELQDAVDSLQQEPEIRGLLISSAKPAFIVGADVTEFPELFRLSDAALKAWLRQTHKLFSTIELLPYPTVAAINGLALGGGFELSLVCDYRVLDTDARVGLPELNFGIYPAWGGSVRLSRLAGLKESLEWMLDGRPQSASAAEIAGVADLLVPSAELQQRALELLRDQVSSGDCHLLKRAEKWALPAGNKALFETLLEKTALNAAHYPAPATLVELVRRHSTLEFNEALEQEVEQFPALSSGRVSASLIGLFLNEQLLKKKSAISAGKAAPVARAAVLGAGIMGGGIAYQSASRGTPILMKDINGNALETGLEEADRLLTKQLEKGRLSADRKDQILSGIDATLDYDDFGTVDLAVEAVVENPTVKASVLAELEQQVSEAAVLTSNTSTISISKLAESLQRPENFCGMHFFNPVPLMPLVEVIRGDRSSDQTIATTVAWARALGKTPIVVNDCPGFLVNRILFPYFNAFNRLLKDGVDFQRIDRVMEAFGWPMGPALLLDVVGIDTAVHADGVMAAGFPERMGHDGRTVIEAMLAEGRLGRKNDRGFYRSAIDEKGSRRRVADDEACGLIETLIARQANSSASRLAIKEISDEEIVERMMIPLCLEAVRCLEEGIAETAAEVDMGLILGLGFPRFRGGPLRYIDHLGADRFCQLTDKHRDQGPLYRPTPGLRKRAQQNKNFFD